MNRTRIRLGLALAALVAAASVGSVQKAEARVFVGIGLPGVYAPPPPVYYAPPPPVYYPPAPAYYAPPPAVVYPYGGYGGYGGGYHYGDWGYHHWRRW